MTKVKICGLSEVRHVKAAVEAGADAIGFVFAPSRRQVTIEQAKELAAYIPESVLKVGVFVNETAAEIHKIFEAVPLDVVQFHGDETPEFIQQVGLPSIKAFSIRNIDDVQAASDYKATPLFDAPGIEYQGGSGQTFNWNLLMGEDIQKQPFILAGGLDTHNVAEAIERVKPTMVDVSSGVEIEKRKDEELIRAFVRAVKSKDEERYA
ncbi:phosphoribosylanthranilate isomerase [Sporosarcina aquimarina]|uniref:N-(5'-phosphoribosyl)anthranilate isomerase n=1 Tax=Sporosarcina aquimarina TaxID=114975 RepID=A0ABU4FZ32_9BACL|nr:phosphoribosylanthranilate isomerase [Sporosarcina aquimarina]MDW0109916.1 phosphoribosylanthranilate isomerase [Sporosarcina aquimarina]